MRLTDCTELIAVIRRKPESSTGGMGSALDEMLRSPFVPTFSRSRRFARVSGIHRMTGLKKVSQALIQHRRLGRVSTPQRRKIGTH
jgi:hypothetical protein